jgi:hypothetical protein
VHSFARGIAQDIDAVTAAITLDHHNGRTEGVNTKTKLIKRQVYGRAGFALLRHRILLGWHHHRKCARAARLTDPEYDIRRPMTPTA